MEKIERIENGYGKFVDKFGETIREPYMYVGAAAGVLLNVVINRGVRIDLASRTIYALALSSIFGTTMKMFED